MTEELSGKQAPRSQPLAAVPRAGHLIDGAYGQQQQVRKTVRFSHPMALGAESG
jgi:hypothetical protein